MTSPIEPDYLILPVGDLDHCQGNPAASITLVQYGDYQCPGCGLAHRIVPLIQQQLGEQLRFVFRHFPQPKLHPEAHHAAEAAEAAASQGKFWEMHHCLYGHQSHLADSHLVEYAIALYLDVNQFLAEMASDCHMPRIQADIHSGIQSGVIRTPTFFINGLKYNHTQSLEGLLEAVVRVNQNEQ
jgi:protein-disulfide isomerase